MIDALLTRTQQRVLGLLFGDCERSFYATEIIKRTGSGSGAVQRELVRLTESGLVTVAWIGNQKHYQVNISAPIFEELRSIIAKTVGLADPLRKALRPLQKKIALALIYGSVARRAEHAKSDVDLLIVSDDMTLEILFSRLKPAERELGRKINPALFTKEEFQRRRARGNAFVRKVLEGPTIPLIGSVDGEHAAR